MEAKATVSGRIAESGWETGKSDSWSRLRGVREVTATARTFSAPGRSHSDESTARSVCSAAKRLLRDWRVTVSGMLTEKTSWPLRKTRMPSCSW